ncbi:hypothetical protein ACQ4PT_055443 [Festuca glaucescens]
MATAVAFIGANVSRGSSMRGSIIVARPSSKITTRRMSSSPLPPTRCAVVGTATPKAETARGGGGRSEQLAVPPRLVDELVEEALVWCSQHGLVVGDKNHPALELAPLFNELVHRVSLDWEFLQQTLARTKEVDPFTRRLLDIHAKMMELNKKDDIQFGLTRSDYMVDGASNKLLQVELNTISTSSNGLACGDFYSYSAFCTRFFNNKSDIEKVRKCFVGLWSLENENIVSDAIESPELFVLKPQREGGGNNIFGDNLRETLIRLRKDRSNDIAAYILMQRIFSPASLAYLVREGNFVRDNAVSEFGMFGAYLRNKDKVIINDQCGYLLRTKAASLNEGGVVAGYAFLNSIFLT